MRAWVPDLPRIEELAFGGAVLPYTVVAVVAVTLLCGLLPAIRTTQTSTGGLLGEARRTQVSGRHALQWLFVGVQVTLAVVLLTGSGLLIRSFLELSQVDPGFEPSRILSFRVSGSYEDFEELAPRVEEILGELQALPGVEAVASSAPVPGVLDDGSGFQFGLAEFKPLEGRTDEDPRVLSEWRVVSPSYFATMQIPLVSGDLCAARQSDPSVMVNTAFAARYFGGASPVGRNLGRVDNDFTYRITGVVGDAREFALDRSPVPTVYACRVAYANPALAFLVRARGDPTAMTASVRTKIKELEPLRAVYDVAPLAERIGDEYSQDRLRMTALSLFSFVALSLACLGVYGTLSYVASLRRREVGLRMALGALRKQIVAQFLAKALAVVALACAAGLALSFALSQLVAGMLFGVSSTDPLTLAVVVGLVTTVAALAALIPALRASRVEPMRVLREE